MKTSTDKIYTFDDVSFKALQRIIPELQGTYNEETKCWNVKNLYAFVSSNWFYEEPSLLYIKPRKNLKDPSYIPLNFITNGDGHPQLVLADKAHTCTTANVFVRTKTDRYSRYDTTTPQERITISWKNPEDLRGKPKVQNYLVVPDALQMAFLKKEDTSVSVAMKYTFVPAKHMVMLELPTIGIQGKNGKKNSTYSNRNKESAANMLADMLGLKSKKFVSLTDNMTAVSQSFTDQMITFGEASIDTEKINCNESIVFVPLNALQSLFDQGIPMSLQTQYQLNLLMEQHKDYTRAHGSSTFKPDKNILGIRDIYPMEDETPYEHKYRFGVRQDFGLDSSLYENGINRKVDIINDAPIYGLSKDSVQCIITRKNKDGKTQIALIHQLRSPFIDRKGINQYFHEIPAGMKDEKDEWPIDADGKFIRDKSGKTIDPFEFAALREAEEETGIKLQNNPNVKTTKIGRALLSLATEEESVWYRIDLPRNYKTGSQKLDKGEAGEVISSNINWINVEDLSPEYIDTLDAPLPTKFGLLMMLQEREREKDFSSRTR